MQMHADRIRFSDTRSAVPVFIHSDYFYSASSSPLLLRGAPNTAWILCQNFTPKRHRQMHADRIRFSDTRSAVPVFIHSDYFYSASSSPLLLRGAPNTAWILCQNFTPKRHRQLWVKDLPKVPARRLEQESNP